MGDMERLAAKIDARRLQIADLENIRAEVTLELPGVRAELAELEKAWELFTR
ncbi:hypothetical protein LCGC14_1687940 [marine sediment metagenome]|uniref:Uncharacterized protein n=1 Tax=marine sediment metagenome TaxID=412755 RepID=A0A0F9HM43_9ZZZZ